MTDHDTADAGHSYGRRQFLGILGAGAVTGAGLATPASAQGPPVVAMDNDYFDPIGLHVEPGTTVRFEIAAGAHSATAYEDRIPAAASAFDTGTIAGGSVDVTFDVEGTYDYYCIPHESIGMTGRIVVGAPGGPATSRSIPSGDVPDSDAIVEAGSITADSFGADDATTGRMGPGMMGGSGGSATPGTALVGGSVAMMGILGGALYWLLGDRSDGAEAVDPAVATLRRRYEQGELEDAEYRRRRRRLQTDEQ